MHQIQEEIGLPKIEFQKINDMHMIFTMSPLPQGYGTTLGNALRRVLLSSLPGAAVTAIKIDGISHEYSTLKGVKDTVLDIILNLRQLHLRKTSKEPSIIKLKAKKEGAVYAKDIQTPSDVIILNPDLYITTLDTKNAKLEIDIRVEKGVGYFPITAREEQQQDSEFIMIDALFSPIQKVRYETESTRVGQMTNLDKLIFEITTNGSITADEAIKFSSNILKSYFGLFNIEEITIEPDFVTDTGKIAAKQKKEEEKKPKQEAYTPIEILGLSPRTLNALINGEIGSIEQLTECSENKLTNLRGFGKKALTEVFSALKSRGLEMKNETSENE